MDKSHGKKEYIPAELSERGRLVGVPQKRGMEAVFSTVRSALRRNHSMSQRMSALTALSDSVFML